MDTIITGNFIQQTQADAVLARLAGAGFGRDRLVSFFVNPPGQHDRQSGAAEGEGTPGAEHAAAGSAAGATMGAAIGVAVGLATLPVMGPGALIAGVGAGAYGGSLYGALGATEEAAASGWMDGHGAPAASEQPRQAGMLVAIAAPGPAEQAEAITILRKAGAIAIERTSGTIASGQWIDFDPLAPLHLIES